MSKRVLIAGARGMLGTDVARLAMARAAARGGETGVIPLDLPELDITNAALVQRTVAAVRPDIIINCAAFTDVDGSESRRETAFAVNAEGPRHLAAAARSVGARLLHVSTDFVFDGTKRAPYVEEDAPRPLSVYGASKLAGEAAVRETTDDHLIVRTSWLFGKHGRNFVSTILRKAADGQVLRVVNDQVGCPTYAKDLAAALWTALDRGLRGTYHLSNGGPTTWYDLACAAAATAGLTATIQPITTADWPRPARVPAYSVLSCERAWRDGRVLLRPWQEALEEFVHADLGLPARA
jgi:dTDP-4-dehydrorhamnose reductase